MAYEWIPYAASALSSLGSAIQNSGSRSNMRLAASLNKDLMEHQAILNQNLAMSMMRAENEYNTPLATMTRELQAGINPFAVAGELGAGRSTPADGAAASVSQAGMSPAPYSNPFSQVSESLANVGSAFNALANAKKAGIETKQLEENLETYLEQQKEQLTKQKLDNNYQRIANDIYQRTGDRTQQLVMQKLAGEVLLNYSTSKKNFASISEIQQNIKESISRMNLNDKQTQSLEKQLPWLVEKLQAEINTINKQGVMYEKQGTASLITANAAHTSALASATNQLQQATNAKELLEGMKKVQSSQEFGNNVNGLAALLDCYMKFKSFPMLQQSLRNKVEQELKNLDWTDTDHVVDNMSKLMNAFSNALGTVGSFIPKTP